MSAADEPTGPITEVASTGVCAAVPSADAGAGGFGTGERTEVPEDAADAADEPETDDGTLPDGPAICGVPATGRSSCTAVSTIPATRGVRAREASEVGAEPAAEAVAPAVTVPAAPVVFVSGASVPPSPAWLSKPGLFSRASLATVLMAFCDSLRMFW